MDTGSTSVAPPAADPAAPPRLLRTRRAALRAVYGLLSLQLLMMSTGLVDLLTGHVPSGPFRYAAGATTAWKLLSLGGYLVLTWTGGRSVLAAQWVVVGQATWCVAELLVPQDPSVARPLLVAQYALIIGLVLSPWLLLAPERRGLLRLDARPDGPASGVAGALLLAGAVWAARASSLPFPTDDGGGELRFDAVGSCLVLGTVGVLAALRPGGRRWLIGCVAAAAAYLGVLALRSPATDLAAPGAAGGIALLAAAALLWWRARAVVGS